MEQAAAAPTPAPTAEQIEAARQRLVSWFEALPDTVKERPSVFWHRATEELKPMSGDLAFELGVMLGRKHLMSAMGAFRYAAANKTPEGLLGLAACFLWQKHADEALVELDNFFKANPFWRAGVERVFNPVLLELFRSGRDIPATMRRSVFAYSFVAYKQGSVLPAASTEECIDDARVWFMSGLPSATQPQVSVGSTLALGAATVVATALVACVAFRGWSPALLCLLLPYLASVRNSVRASKLRKATRRSLASLWAERQ